MLHVQYPCVQVIVSDAEPVVGISKILQSHFFLVLGLDDDLELG